MSEPHQSTNVGPASPSCAKCNATPAQLKRCAKCRSVSYCNRECQKAHWKTHKKDCTRLANETHPSSNTARATSSGADSNPDMQQPKPFTAIYENKYLHDKPESLTYKILVDILRMRQEDMYSLEGDTMPGTIYNGELSSERAFRNMIQRAKRVTGFLPPWWTDAKEAACIRLSRGALQCAREKADIQEEWGDPLMPMKLRLMGEILYGSTPGAMGKRTGPQVLQMQMRMERGEFAVSSHLELASTRA